MKTISIYAFVLSALLTACAAPRTAPQVDETRSRLQIAEAMFQERCKSAGEKIDKTVDDVEGIFLMKVRPEKVNFSDQFAMTDPYGDDTGGRGYIENFLRGRGSSGSLTSEGITKNGYQYVEAIDSKDGGRYRYAGSIKEVMHTSSLLMGGDGRTTFKTQDYVLDRTPATGPMPRFGVTYDDISTREEREYWIAGSSLKIIDLQTNEVIAERIGYMMDRGQGNTSGGRSPWLLARYHACPSFPTGGGRPVQIHQTRNFVEKVLHIKQGN
jgi:hypothetical protein